MAKLKKVGPVVAIVLGVVAIIMLFLPAITYTAGGEKYNYSGFKVMFGYKETYAGITMEVFKFSFGNFLVLLLTVVGIVFAVLAKLGKLGKISPIVAAVAFLVAGILFFCMKSMIAGSDEVKETVKEFSLGAGAVIGGILSIIAAILSVLPVFAKE